MNPSLTLVATAFTHKQLIFPELPQIALAGRSNVGKSSLVNALAGRRQLAKTSATPGKTRSINYYALSGAGFAEPTVPENSTKLKESGAFNEKISGPEQVDSPVDKQAFLVDLPGYGYAKCSKTERNAWANLLELYLRETPGLLALALLIDSRLPPQKIDIQLAEMALKMGLPLIPVLTKIDKSKQKEREACLKGWSAIVDGFRPVLTSSQSKKGIEELWDIFINVLG